MDIVDKSVVDVVGLEHHILMIIHTHIRQTEVRRTIITLEFVREVVERRQVELKRILQPIAVQSVTKCSVHTQRVNFHSQAMVLVVTRLLVQTVAL